MMPLIQEELRKMGRRKQLTPAESRRLRSSAGYAPKISNLVERASILVPPETKSPQYKRPFFSKREIVVIPPDRVGAKPAPFRMKRAESLPIKSTLSKPIQKSSKKSTKKPQPPPILGAMKFKDGVRFVQGGLPELGRYR